MEDMRTLPIAQLVEDMAIYPRHRIDDEHVGALADVLRAGGTLPPPVVDAASYRIVDGWHRVRAMRRVLGPEAEVSVIARVYASEADIVADAVRLNSAHGKRFQRIDQIRAVYLLSGLGLNRETIAVLLQVPETRIEQWEVRVAIAPQPHASIPIPLKRPVLHLQGQTLTPEQEAVHRELGGTSFLLTARQLRRALEAGLVNLGDERLVDELRALHKALGDALAGLEGTVGG